MQKQSQLSKQSGKQIEREMTSSFSLLLPKTKVKTLQAEKQIQRSRQREREIQREIQRERIIERPPKTPKPIPGGSLPSSKSLSKISRAQSKAYRLLVKRFGKYKPMGEFTRGRALMKGERIAKTTLAASFKLEPTSKLLNKKDIDFAVGREFRSYKIKKGKKVPLMDEFIQRRGTRLGTRSEVQELMRFKKRKVKRRRK